MARPLRFLMLQPWYPLADAIVHNCCAGRSYMFHGGGHHCWSTESCFLAAVPLAHRWLHRLEGKRYEFHSIHFSSSILFLFLKYICHYNKIELNCCQFEQKLVKSWSIFTPSCRATTFHCSRLPRCLWKKFVGETESNALSDPSRHSDATSSIGSIIPGKQASHNGFSLGTTYLKRCKE